MSRCNILNTCQKIHISEALILSSICLTSVYDSEAYKKQESTLKSSVKPKKQAQEGFCAKKGGTINTFRLGEQYIIFRCGNNIYFSVGRTIYTFQVGNNIYFLGVGTIYTFQVGNGAEFHKKALDMFLPFCLYSMKNMVKFVFWLFLWIEIHSKNHLGVSTPMFMSNKV